MPTFSKTRVYLSLGSNIGERKRNLEAAVSRIKSFVEELKISAIYETQPLYFIEQPKFLNIAVSCLTGLTPSALLDRLQAIEKDLGRNRQIEVRMGPRVIDIDILLYGDRIINQPGLTIPHPEINKRRFLLIPLMELDPDLCNPLTNEPFSSILPTLKDQGVYTFSIWDYTGGPTG
ncbi:Bifunctional folate synthesis protein [subsurface metagenome]